MGTVPAMPPKILAWGDDSRVRAAAPVIGNGQWREVADLFNWLQGHGAQLVCGNPRMLISSAEGFGAPFGEIAPGGGGFAYMHYVWPRTQFTRRVWLVAIGTAGAGTASGTFKDQSGLVTLGRWSISSTEDTTQPVQHFRVVEQWTPATGMTGLYMTCDSSSSTGAFLYGSCCFELPIVSSSDVTNEQTLNTNEPIYEASDNLSSLDVLARGAVLLPTYNRRAGLFSWFSNTPLVISAVTFTGTGNVFRVPPTCIPRTLYSGTTTATVNWAMYGNATGGNAEIRVSWSGSGHTTTVTVGTTSLTAITGASLVKSEDISRLGTDGGIRGGTRDFATIEVRRTTASQYSIYGFYMGEG